MRNKQINMPKHLFKIGDELSDSQAKKLKLIVNIICYKNNRITVSSIMDITEDSEG